MYHFQRTLPPLLLLLLTLCSSKLYAQEKTATGFYYPIGASSWSQGGSWLTRDPAHGGTYFDGYYHTGEDMMLGAGGNVYAISSGVVTYLSTDGWGVGNIGLGIKHQLNDDSYFTAVYGHIISSLNVGDSVTAGQVIGVTGHWDYGDHLHFGVSPTTSLPATGWGRLPNSAWDSTNGFVDPVNWIRTRYPKGVAPAEHKATFTLTPVMLAQRTVHKVSRSAISTVQ